MPDPGENADGESGDSSGSMWVKTGIAAGLGFELLGLVLAGAYVGTRVDARFDTSPVGLLVSMGLAFVVAGWHIYLVSRRLSSEDDD